jgi:DNA-binding NarL/FixJ family response regulator
MSTARVGIKPGAPLSPREVEVLRLLCKGFTIKATAHALGLAHSTVCCYLANLMAKMQASTRAEVAYRAGVEGLV